MKEQFMADLQKAFKSGVEAEFGSSDKVEEVITRKDIEESLSAKGAQAFMAMERVQMVGGCVVNINPDTQQNSLNLLYVKTDYPRRGIGGKIWNEIERMFPQTKVWLT